MLALSESKVSAAGHCPEAHHSHDNYLVVITVFIDCKLNEMRGNVYHSYQVTNPSSSLLNTPNSLSQKISFDPVAVSHTWTLLLSLQPVAEKIILKKQRPVENFNYH